MKNRIENLTEGQKKGMLEMLSNSTNLTGPEREILTQLRVYFKKTIIAVRCHELLKINQRPIEMILSECGGYVKMLWLDTFGEDYRNRWVKLRESSKGQYFNMKYLGDERWYLI